MHTVPEEALLELESLTREIGELHELKRNVRQWTARSRWKPIGGMLHQFAESAAALALRLEKEIRTEILGADTRIDFERCGPVLSNLIHLVRNSVDHGIENPWERGQKPNAGTLRLSCFADAHEWVFQVFDDGKGIDPDEVGQLAVDRGTIADDELRQMDKQQKSLLIFAPGFSTSSIVTDISGRGYGLSALADSVNRLGGVIKIQSVCGSFTEFTIKIPHTQTERASEPPSCVSRALQPATLDRSPSNS